jgi:hypothetical protein
VNALSDAVAQEQVAKGRQKKKPMGNSALVSNQELDMNRDIFEDY